MERRRDLSDDLKKVIVNLALRGHSLRDISRKVNKPHSTVNYIVNKFRYRGSTKNLPRRAQEKK